MKPIDVKDNYFCIMNTEQTSKNIFTYNEESNETDPKFKVGDNVRVSKYKNIFAKGYAPAWSEEVFVINKLKKYCSLDNYYF